MIPVLAGDRRLPGASQPVHRANGEALGSVKTLFEKIMCRVIEEETL